MKTIEATITVTEDGQLIMTAPPKLPAGKHRVVVLIDEPSTPVSHGKKQLPFQLPPHAAGLTDDQFTFRRQELYDD
jgi:hypothetical protein